METRVGEDESKNKVAKIIFKEVSSNCPALPLLLNSSLPAGPAAGPAGSSCLLRWADAGGEQLLGKMAVKRSKFAEVPPITVKLVGLKHWEVRASWLFQSGIRCCGAVCYFGLCKPPGYRAAVPVVSLGPHQVQP